MQKFKEIANIFRAVGQHPKEHKEISQMHFKKLLLWTKIFAAASIKIWKKTDQFWHFKDRNSQKNQTH